MAGVPSEILELARRARRITVLTGAGMSAESGVPTFRDAQTGLWSRYNPEDLATPDAWARDRDLVWAWYLGRIRGVRAARPNAGHRALARWPQHAHVRIVTQNVDDLHERAGSEVIAHVHGALVAFRCDTCDRPFDGEVDLGSDGVERYPPPPCPHCPPGRGHIRPGVVWFGEAMPVEPFERAVDAVRDADLVLVVGTSGMVYPAASLPDLARAAGVPVIEINPSETGLTWSCTHSWRTTAAVGLPALVDALGPGSGD